MVHERGVEVEERGRRAWGIVPPKYPISGHGDVTKGGAIRGDHMIATKHDHTKRTVICRRLAIKVAKTLDINVPGKKSRPE